MNHIKKYEQWLNEDFAAVGVAPEGNVSGMGPVVGPNAANVGSGDTWASGKRSKRVYKRCPVCKKKKCVCEE